MNLNQKTLETLSTAMHGEAVARKYLLFAEHVRRSGDPELASLLKRTAKGRVIRALRCEGIIGGNGRFRSKQSEDVIKDEAYEWETMCRDFAQQAEQAGDH